jgi:hypothetical protein
LISRTDSRSLAATSHFLHVPMSSIGTARKLARAPNGCATWTREELAATAHNRGARSRHLTGAGSNLVSRAPLESDDSAGTWTYEELKRMDAAFVAAVEVAFRLGLESPAAAAATQRFKRSAGLPYWGARAASSFLPAAE